MCPAETAPPKNQELKIGGNAIRTQGDAYVATLRDWADKGPKSEFVVSDEDDQRRVKERSPAETGAGASFKVAVTLRRKGQPDLTQKWF